MRAITLCLSLLACSIAHAADLTIPTTSEVDPSISTKCVNDGVSTISVGSTDGTYLYGTASFSGWVCRLRVHAGRGPGIRLLSGCADVVWSASTGEVVSITYQGAICAQ